MAQVASNSPGQLQVKNLAVATNNATSVVLAETNIPPGLFRIAGVLNPTVRALTAFLIEGKFHPEGVYQTISSGVSAASTAPFQGVNATLTTLAAGSVGWFFMDVKGLCAVRISATGSVDGTGLTDFFLFGTA